MDLSTIFIVFYVIGNSALFLGFAYLAYIAYKWFLSLYRESQIEEEINKLFEN